MTDTLTILTAARKIIAYPAMWYKGDWTASGEWDDGGPCCALCAIKRAASAVGVQPFVAVRYIGEFTPDQEGVSWFNDRPSTKHSDVLVVFDRAIAVLEVGT